MAPTFMTLTSPSGKKILLNVGEVMYVEDVEDAIVIVMSGGEVIDVAMSFQDFLDTLQNYAANRGGRFMP